MPPHGHAQTLAAAVKQPWWEDLPVRPGEGVFWWMVTDTRQQNRDRWPWRIMSTAGCWLVTAGSRWQARVDTAHWVAYPLQAAVKATQFRAVTNALTPIISIETGAFV